MGRKGSTRCARRTSSIQGVIDDAKTFKPVRQNLKIKK